MSACFTRQILDTKNCFALGDACYPWTFHHVPVHKVVRDARVTFPADSDIEMEAGWL